MNIALLGDTHFGVRGDSLDFHNYFKEYYRDYFFPTLKENGVELIIQFGDIFDRRKFINIHSLYLAREYFFDILEQNGIKMITILGNHDIYFKDTLEVNSPQLLLRDYKNIEIINTITTREIGGRNFTFVPWIIGNEIPELINDLTGDICIGHFEVNGFQVTVGNEFKGGMLSDAFKGFDMVLSGHFHHKSTSGNIHFLGTPTENTWGDYNDQRGIHILDTSDMTIKFIENPIKMFHKLIYDDTKYNSTFWENFDTEPLNGRYVKLIVIEKNDSILFDKVLATLEDSHIADLKVIETTEDFEEQEVNQAEDTMTILTNFVDNQSIEKKEVVKDILGNLYTEAISRQGSFS